MLYKALLKIKTSKGFDDAMRTKIDVFYALGRLTAEEYRKLLDLPEEDTKDRADDADTKANTGADDPAADANTGAADAAAETVQEAAE